MFSKFLKTSCHLQHLNLLMHLKVQQESHLIQSNNQSLVVSACVLHVGSSIAEFVELLLLIKMLKAWWLWKETKAICSMTSNTSVSYMTSVLTENSTLEWGYYTRVCIRVLPFGSLHSHSCVIYIYFTSLPCNKVHAKDVKQTLFLLKIFYFNKQMPKSSLDYWIYCEMQCDMFMDMSSQNYIFAIYVSDIKFKSGKQQLKRYSARSGTCQTNQQTTGRDLEDNVTRCLLNLSNFVYNHFNPMQCLCYIHFVAVAHRCKIIVAAAVSSRHNDYFN